MKKKEKIESLSPAERMGRLLVTVVKYFSLLLATFLVLLPLISCLLDRSRDNRIAFCSARPERAGLFPKHLWRFSP